MENFEIEESRKGRSICNWKVNYLPFCFVLLATFLALLFYSFAFPHVDVENLETIGNHDDAPLRDALSEDEMEEGCEEDYCLTKGCISVAARMVTLMDDTIDPCVDFYGYACGNYGETRSVRSGEYVYDPFTEVKDNLLVYIKKSMDDLSGVTLTETFNKTKQFFDSCMDNGGIESPFAAMMGPQNDKKDNETWPLLNFLEAAGISWPILENMSIPEVYNNWTHPVFVMENVGFHTLFRPKFTAFEDNQTVILDVDCSLVTFPINYYITPTETKYEDLLMWYDSVIVLMMHHMKIPRKEAKKVTKRILEVERHLAHALMDIEEIEEGSRDCDQPCGKSWCVPCKEQTVAERYPLSEEHVEQIRNIWSSTLKRSKADIKVRSICPYNLEAAMKTLNEIPSRSVLNFIGWRSVMHLTQFMSTKFQDLYSHYVERTLRSTSVPISKWRECAEIVRQQLSPPIAKMLIEKSYLKEEQRKKMQERFVEMKNAFKAVFRSISWLNNQTIEAFSTKLDKMTLHIGYPNSLEDSVTMDEAYYELQINPSDTFLFNMLRLRAFRERKHFARLTHDYYTDKLSVIDLNHGYLDTESSYDYVKNEVRVDLGLLLSPVFKFGEGLAEYLEYGQSVFLAREISHAFDTKGIEYDGNGNHLGIEFLPEFINTKFHSFVLCLKEQQDLPMDIDKDIADLGAAFITSAALELHLIKAHDEEEEKPLPALPKSKQKLYFLQNAQLFCQLADKPVLDLPPSGKKNRKERLHFILGNMVNFGSTFGCSAGTPMNPHKKCNLLSA